MLTLCFIFVAVIVCYGNEVRNTLKKVAKNKNIIRVISLFMGFGLVWLLLWSVKDHIGVVYPVLIGFMAILAIVVLLVTFIVSSID